MSLGIPRAIGPPEGLVVQAMVQLSVGRARSVVDSWDREARKPHC